MRQIYTSPRYENVERVVALLNQADIQTTVRNRRDWQGGQWKRFSYTERGESESWAQVWVTHSNDQTRAREILREAGLEPATRFADELAAARSPSDPRRHKANSMRIRMILLALIGGVLLLMMTRYLLGF
ncbi:MAG TPA: hypothetical protein VFN25_14210 [Dokdonella sp.]|uniref:hypothetical protein n=1 Tax=Dokdonella sp. TaxID=2291710 RepID=UPI002D7F58B1|nr:hypothetical protein [Dokdonella sp.]HET9034043.1 hypothetical protein [Dokdonella sp.]